MSDERTKENKQVVGELDNGLPIYKFNYKGDNKTQIGVMAQDVEKDNPSAVKEIGGIKMVDYNKATKKYASGGLVASPGGGGFSDIIQQIFGAAGGASTGGAGGSAGGLGDIAGIAKMLGGEADKQDEERKAKMAAENQVLSQALSNSFEKFDNPYSNLTNTMDNIFMQNRGALFAEGGLVDDKVEVTDVIPKLKDEAFSKLEAKMSRLETDDKMKQLVNQFMGGKLPSQMDTPIANSAPQGSTGLDRFKEIMDTLGLNKQGENTPKGPRANPLMAALMAGVARIKFSIS